MCISVCVCVCMREREREREEFLLIPPIPIQHTTGLFLAFLISLLLTSFLDIIKSDI